MLYKTWLAPAILSIGGLLMSANAALAQRGGHGGHSGGHSSGHAASHSSGGHAGAHSSGGAHYSGGHYYSGHYHDGYYNRRFYPGYFGGYFPWSDDYTYPTYTYPSDSYYYTPSAPYYEPPIQSAPAPIAYIRVIVPDPQARIWFDGAATMQTGTDRLFNTPSLTIGSTYNYRVRAAWMQDGREVTQERTASVTPGQTTMVDFSR
jgi:uncharacterized protein (TIGR03000 family)